MISQLGNRLDPGGGARHRGARQIQRGRCPAGAPGPGAQQDRFSAAHARPGHRPRASKTDSARPRPRLGAPGPGAQDTFSVADARAGGRQAQERKTDSARRARIGPDHTRLAVCVGSCRLYPDVRTRLPATPAHFIGCFFCTPCGTAQPRPCMAFSGVPWHWLALRSPAPKGGIPQRREGVVSPVLPV